MIGKRGSRGCLGSSHYLEIGYKDGNTYRVHEIIAVDGGLDILNNTVDHVNGNKLDNRLCNLQVLSLEDNTRKGGKEPTRYSQGSQHYKSSLTNEDVKEIQLMLEDNRLKQSIIAWLYNVKPYVISDIKNGRAWKNI